MSTFRSRALQQTLNRKPVLISENHNRSAYFGSHVFNEESMQQYLTKDAFEGVRNAVKHGSSIDRKIADQIANSMKNWALAKVPHTIHIGFNL